MAAEHWKQEGKNVPDEYKDKLQLMSSFCGRHDVTSVPDPYYGGPSGFENVLNLLDDACLGLLKHIQGK